MKIHVYTVCQNEVDLLPHYLDYFGNIASEIFVFDNQSTDGTRELLEENSLTTVIDYDTKGVLRDDIHMWIKNSAWKSSIGIADWIIINDLDEFPYHVDFQNYLQKCKKHGYTILESVGFNMISNSYPILNIPIVEQVKYGAYSKRFSKSIIFDPNKIIEINTSPGGHMVDPVGDIRYKKSEGMYLLHYKYLGGIERLIKRWDEVGFTLSKINEKYSWGIKRKVPEEIIKRYDYVNKNKVNVIELDWKKLIFEGETFV